MDKTWLIDIAFAFLMYWVGWYMGFRARLQEPIIPSKARIWAFCKRLMRRKED